MSQKYVVRSRDWPMKGIPLARKGEPDAAGRLSGLNDVSIRVTASLDTAPVPQEVEDGVR